jgi:hypothetical protein
MNVIGAGTACVASVMLRYLPFIILEGCWTLVSAIGLAAFLKNKLWQEKKTWESS